MPSRALDALEALPSAVYGENAILRAPFAIPRDPSDGEREIARRGGKSSQAGERSSARRSQSARSAAAS
jgi:hypothetical protein